MENCSFIACKSTVDSTRYEGGGAIVIEADAGTQDICYCLFDSCKAQLCGGAIVIAQSASSVVVLGCEIRNCLASRGGGISASSDSSSLSLTVSWVSIIDCSADPSYGQAIHIFSCKSFKWDHLCITGTGTLVKSGTSSISVPATQELTKECLMTARFTQSPYFNRQLKLASLGHYVLFVLLY